MRTRGVSRRAAREQTKKPGQTLAQQFSALFQTGDSWFDADNVATSGGKVVSFVDRRDGAHLLTQADTTYQAGVPSTSALFGGKNVASLSAHYYQSNRAASAWSYLNGVSEVYIVARYNFAALGVLLETASGSTNGYLLFSSNPGDLAFWVWRPTTLVAAGQTSLSGVAASVTRTVVQSGQMGLKVTGKTEATSVISESTPGAAKTLAFGARAAANSPWVGEFRSLYTFQRNLTAPERAIVEAYIIADCGVSAT